MNERMIFEISDGFLIELWRKNRKGEQVFPHIKSKRSSVAEGFEITLTGRKRDYDIVDLEKFIDHIAAGDFEEVGRVRMKSKGGGRSNGFAVRKAMMSPKLRDEIERRQRLKNNQFASLE